MLIALRDVISVTASAANPARADTSIARCAPSRLDATPRATMPVGKATPIVVLSKPSAAARSCGATAATGSVACVEPNNACPIPAMPRASKVTVTSGV
jgi:hypothetical protein